MARRPARAGTYAKMPLDYEQNNPWSILLFIETKLMQKNPQTFLLFTTVRPSVIHARSGAAAMALDGHTSQLGPTLAQPISRPPSKTLALTLA